MEKLEIKMKAKPKQKEVNKFIKNPLPLDEIKIAVGQWLKTRKRAKNKQNSTERLVWDKLNDWIKSW